MGNNSIHYEILDKKGNSVGSHRQNIMCSRCNDGLEKYQPPSEFTIKPYGYDDYDDGGDWEGDHINLDEWLKRNPAQITFKEFEVGESARAFIKGELGISYNRREECVVKDVRKGQWLNEYTVELSDGTLLEVSQTHLLPIKIK